jgi:hypothetical protein
MWQGELVGVQTQPRGRPALGIVERVTYHRAADVGQMDPDLVRPAGFRDNFQD